MVATASRKQRIRTVTSSEAQAITALARRSTAHWGYADAALEARRDRFTVTAQYIENALVSVVEVEGVILGFYGLSVRSDNTLWLDYLFVEPDAIGAGYGKKMWRHACITAQNFGFHEFFLQCDGHSAPFYTRMGATAIAQVGGKATGRLSIAQTVMRYEL